MFKKLLTLLMSMTLILTVTACGGGSATISVSSDDNGSSTIKAVSSGNLRSQIQNLTTMADTVTFGTTTDSKEPIEWYVLEDDGSKALLLSKYLLAEHTYNDEQEDVTWETCTMRKWLNTEYINLIFSKNEQKSILTTDVVNNNNESYGTNGGNNTKDKLFLLSIDEFKKYYPSGSEATYKGGSSYFWYLRSTGPNYAFVDLNGDFRDNGDATNANGIRPALWVKY